MIAFERENHMSRFRSVSLAGSGRIAVYAAGILLCASQALAADHARSTDAQALYKRDRAACMSRTSAEDRAVCLREAGAALQEAKRGGLSDEQAGFERNRLLRCDSQPAQDRGDCIRRMNGEGSTTGSVESGAIIRELRTPVEPAKRE